MAEPTGGDDLRRAIVSELRAQNRAPSPYIMLLLGAAAPIILAVLGGGRLMGEIENNAQAIARQDAHLTTIDLRVQQLEQRQGGIANNSQWIQRQEEHLSALDVRLQILESGQAVINSLLDRQFNVTRVPFEDSPTSPPGPKQRH